MIELAKPIVRRLKQIFGDEITIYTEGQKQGVKTPCFFIKLIDADIVRQMNDFFFFNNIANIVYMGDTNDLYELEKIRFQMLTGLEQIQLKHAGVTGNNPRAKIKGNDVIMTIDYDIWMEKVKVPDPLMKRLKQEGKIKG